ncbi:hypothetical protein [Planktotalea sp.]|uniref:hypothetical protein n=1 Tax=Planktotalea sp. TaxID=2029877 RepID=UPI003D6AA8AC
MTDKPKSPGEVAMGILNALAEGTPKTSAELQLALSADRRQVYSAARWLMREEYAARPQLGVYQITEKGCVAQARGTRLTSGPKSRHGTIPKYKETFRTRAWRSMRVRRKFTIGDLISDAAVGNAPEQSRSNATRYVKQLSLAGYVCELKKREPGTAIGSNGFKRFALMRDTGPIAPAWRQEAGALHDFNTGEDVQCPR